MGNYFVMSMRFNKRYASDFGLISTDEKTAFNPSDNSVWMRCNLYDFGWGKENGFYKMPLPNFEVLLSIALFSTDREDKYGSAAIILEKYADELLYECEELMRNHRKKKDFKKLVELFKLGTAINRCSIIGKSQEEIQADYARWKTVSAIARGQ